jgi:hypothetical protein
MSETRPLLEPIYDVTDGIASPASKIQYRFAFGRFLEYIQISQEGLLQKNSKELQALIIDYIRHLTAKRMKPGTIKLRVAVILHFLVPTWIRLIFSFALKILASRKTVLQTYLTDVFWSNAF